jgi:leader peptidase (prepilin peptidase) / N-methyltransferase
MEIAAYFKEFPAFFILVAGITGLLVGSFLNVVIYRLPVMMQRSWRKDCLEYLEIPPDSNPPSARFDLVFPNSRCPHCETPIKPYQNIPVLSYLSLQGKCANCHARIPLRYPIIEALSGLLSLAVAWHFGVSLQTAFALLLTWSLIALCFIDIDHQLLPDSIVLPMLWLGLLLSLWGVFADSHDSILGAVWGYLSLWAVFHLFKLATGKEGMGYGDFKLLALFGAWLGWQALPAIIFLSSLVGAVTGVVMILFSGHDRNKPIPFGPYLAAAGWLALMWGDRINDYYSRLAGL